MAKSKQEISEENLELILSEVEQGEEIVIETPVKQEVKKVAKADYFQGIKIEEVIYRRGTFYDVKLADGRVETIHKNQITTK